MPFAGLLLLVTLNALLVTACFVGIVGLLGFVACAVFPLPLPANNYAMGLILLQASTFILLPKDLLPFPALHSFIILIHTKII